MSKNFRITFPEPAKGQSHWQIYGIHPTFTTPPDTRTRTQKWLYKAFVRLGETLREWSYKSYDIADRWAKPSAVQTGSKHVKISTVQIEDTK